MQRLIATPLALLALVLIAACSTLAPVQSAETTEQRAFAAYGTFVVYQEAAASLMPDPTVPDAVKRQIQRIDADAQPIVQSMADAVRELSRVRAEYEAGEAEAGAVRTAAANVERWVRELQPVLTRLIETVEGAA